MPSGHTFYDFYENITPGSVFFTYLFVMLFIGAVKLGLERCNCCRCGCKLPTRPKNVQVIQELVNFYSALPKHVRESLIREEVQDALRTDTSKMSKEMLLDLVLAEDVKDKSL